MALAGTRQLRSQGPVSVHAYCTEGVTRFEGRERGRDGGGNKNGDGDGGGGKRMNARKRGGGGGGNGGVDESTNARRER